MSKHNGECVCVVCDHTMVWVCDHTMVCVCVGVCVCVCVCVCGWVGVCVGVWVCCVSIQWCLYILYVLSIHSQCYMDALSWQPGLLALM